MVCVASIIAHPAMGPRGTLQVSPFAEEAGRARAACSPAPPGLPHTAWGSPLLWLLQKAAESLVLLHQMPPSIQPCFCKPELPTHWTVGHDTVLFLHATPLQFHPMCVWDFCHCGASSWSPVNTENK